ncbi:MAG TPA: hypothetical protein VFZ45_02035 [Actinomycetota bacterium]|nr:hypothetical protein [Actinomycetota bacterium]
MARRVAVAVTAASFLLVGLPGEVGAHDVSLTPNVSRTKVPKGALERGDLVVVVGRVKTNDATCFGSVTVELVRVIQNVGERVLGTTTTNAQGKYWFKRRVKKDQRWFVRFPGFQVIETGHNHTCGAAVSKGVRIRISTG